MVSSKVFEEFENIFASSKKAFSKLPEAAEGTGNLLMKPLQWTDYLVSQPLRLANKVIQKYPTFSAVAGTAAAATVVNHYINSDKPETPDFSGVVNDVAANQEAGMNALNTIAMQQVQQPSSRGVSSMQYQGMMQPQMAMGQYR